jgi:hypothetical protein
MQSREAPFEKFLRKRFDTGESRAVVFRGRFPQNQGREAAADFDYRPWLKVADHAVGNQGVRAIKETVV